MKTIHDVEGLVGNVTIEGEHYGDVRCHTLTVAYRAILHGNVICDTLQNGGRINGIVVSRDARQNEKGYLNGTLYYEVQQNKGKANGSSCLPPPPTVWALLMPEVETEEYSPISFDDAAIDLAFASVVESELSPAVDAFVEEVPEDVQVSSTLEATVADELTVVESTAKTAVVESVLVLETGPKAPKLSQPQTPAFSNPFTVREPAPSVVQTARQKVTLPGRFF